MDRTAVLKPAMKRAGFTTQSYMGTNDQFLVYRNGEFIGHVDLKQSNHTTVWEYLKATYDVEVVIPGA